ncbi:thiamine-phosphate kinase [Marinicauda sp. Alg238-R41]|uniref:thiamine-phosphate kinase n=1 Tax=Marinicauda sp. Alg238-R41 TaxID=2993447 RepID=UPI0022DFA5B1|nr:thiamine-phosphate kinase [Marinicauda sp. Alg238-R41]
MARYGEFDLIASLLAPLASGHPGAYGLRDDAATIAPEDGHEFVVTADTLVEGRHFSEGDDAGDIARKALRANLSDLAAMGARARFYLSSLVWPDKTEAGFQRRFVSGWAADQERYGVTLIGGDITASPGPFVIQITAIGDVPLGRAVRRDGARPGDLLAVTGTIGDAGLGLACRTGKLDLEDRHSQALIERHLRPEPRLGIAEALRRYADAAIDISDGLIADAGHIASASECSLTIDLEDMPVSAGAQAWLDRQQDEAAGRVALATSGDDYELACAVPPDHVGGFADACRHAGLGLTVLGRFDAGEGVTVRHRGKTREISRAGFTHF